MVSSAAQGLPSGCRLAGGGSSRLDQPGHEGWPGCAHLHQTEVSSHASYLLNQHGSMVRAPPDRIVITCEPGSRQQVQTIVQLIPESHHGYHLRSFCVDTPPQSHRHAGHTRAKLPIDVPISHSAERIPESESCRLV